MKNKIEVSLTDFVDFVCKSGSSKQTKVKQIKERGPYSPATDYYKGAREGLISTHREGNQRKDLSKIIDAITDSKKVENYHEIVSGYSKFWGRKKITWFDPTQMYWTSGDLSVKVNPELGLNIDGTKYLVKLYFKKEKLSKDRVSQVLTLMEHTLRKSVGKHTIMAILDIKQSRFFEHNGDTELLPLLEGESKSLETIWNAL